MTDTTTPSMREAFEKYYKLDDGVSMPRNGEGYKYGTTQLAWLTWQAATANMHKDFDALWNIYRERVDKVSAQIKTIAELEAKIAELQKDADRYRWLANNSDGNYQDDFIIRLNRELFSSRREFDEAIDAAIAEEGVK